MCREHSWVMELPTFSEFSERYLAEDASHLAPMTRSDLDSYLREGGPLLALVDEVRGDDPSQELIADAFQHAATPPNPGDLK